MSRPKEFDVHAALRAAEEAFWEKGYGATSVDDLVRRTGVQRASLYATFGGKRALFLSALRRYHEETLEAVASALAAAKSPRQALKGLFRTVIDEACAEGGRRGCLSVNTRVELAPHDRVVAAMIRKHGERGEALLAATIRRGIDAGEFARGTDPVAVARFLGAAMLGLFVFAKTAPGRKALTDVVSTAMSVLDA